MKLGTAEVGTIVVSGGNEYTVTEIRFSTVCLDDEFWAPANMGVDSIRVPKGEEEEQL